MGKYITTGKNKNTGEMPVVYDLLSSRMVYKRINAMEDLPLMYFYYRHL